MTAAELKITEWKPGTRFRITDPDHPMVGRTGVLEFKGLAKAFLMIDGVCWPADVNKLVLMPDLKVVA